MIPHFALAPVSVNANVTEVVAAVMGKKLTCITHHVAHAGASGAEHSTQVTSAVMHCLNYKPATVITQ